MTTTPQHDDHQSAEPPVVAAPADITNPASPAPAPPDRPRSDDPVHRSRIGAVWVGVIAAAIVLILLLIFILQNSRSVKISYLGMHGHLSLAVAMLLSAIAGILLIAIPGSARIMQLRRGVRRSHAAKR